MVGDDLAFVAVPGDHCRAIQSVDLTRPGQQDPALFHSSVMWITEILIGNALGDVRIDLEEVRAVEEEHAVISRNSAEARW